MKIKYIDSYSTPIPITTCFCIYASLSLFPFHSSWEYAATSNFVFNLVLTYGSLSGWVRGWGTPGHLSMGGGVLRKKI